MIIDFKVKGQTIDRVDRNIVIADSRNYLRARFKFLSNEWNTTKTAIFTKDSKSYRMILENDECLVPHEVLDGGDFTVSLFTGDLLTTNTIIVDVKPSGYVGNEDDPSAPTPDQYTQLLARVDSSFDILYRKLNNMEILSDVDYAAEELSNLQNGLAEQSKKLTAHTESINTNAQHITEQGETLEDHTEKLENQAENISTNAKNISANTKKIAENEKAIKTNSDNITALSEKVAADESTIREHTTQLSSHKDSIDSLTEGYNAHQEKLLNHHKAINNLEKSLNNKLNAIYTSNLGESYITDCQEGDIRNLKIDGKTEQKQYMGYQLLSNYLPYGCEIIKNEDGCIKVNVTSQKYPQIGGNTYLEIGDYLLHVDSIEDSYGNKTPDLRIFSVTSETDTTCINDKAINCSCISNNVISFKIVTAGYYRAWCRTKNFINNYQNGENTATITVKNIMLEKGTEVHEYEPYVGGMPSPSPEYPQEIKNVSQVNVKVCGKNLLEKCILGTKYTSKGITFTVTESGIDIKGTLTEKGSANWRIHDDVNCPLTDGYYYIAADVPYVYSSDDSNIYINNFYSIGDYLINLNRKVNKNTCHIVLSVRGEKGDTFDAHVKIMLTHEKVASITDEYEPYKEQVVTIDDVELCKIGNHADVIDVESGVIRKNIYKFNSSEMVKKVSDFSRYSSENKDKYRHYVIWHDDILCKKPVISNLFKSESDIWLNKKTGIGVVEANRIDFSVSNSILGIDENTSDTESTKIMRKMLEETPLIWYQSLVTPIEIPIPTEILAKLRALRMYSGVTNVFVTDQDGNDISNMFDYHFNLKPFVEHIKAQVGVEKDLIYDMQSQVEDSETDTACAYIEGAYSTALLTLSMED